MKKAMLLASLAAMLISSNAMALVGDPALKRGIEVAGQRAGEARIALLGPGPGSPLAPFGTCQYYMAWSPPGGFGSALPCILAEVQNTDSLGCFLNQGKNFTTTVVAGKNHVVPTFCAGFDQNGISYFKDGITLVLSELAIHPGGGAPSLVGTALYPFVFTFPQSIVIF